MKKNIIKKCRAALALAAAVLLLAGCAAASDKTADKSSELSSISEEMSSSEASNSSFERAEADSSSSASAVKEAEELSEELTEDDQAPVIDTLSYKGSLKLEYAKQFKVHYYEDDYALIDIADGEKYLIVPKGKEFNGELEENYKLIYGPVENIYLAATSAMALFDAMNALDNIGFSGTQASGWYIENAVAAMENGDIVYAGKYSEPDYELLLNNNCELAVESTMILHSPKVQEMLETLGIPVFIDRSSYEEHPLGRTEWIKAYAVLTGSMQEAEKFFRTQSDIAKESEEYTKTDKTVAYFYIATDGTAVVRNTNDYIPKMIELAGGNYIFEGSIDGDISGANVSMSIEQFYDSAFDADYIIYNASIDNPLSCADDLIAKNELFAEFKAVKEGNVWSTGKSLYQATDRVAEFIKDINRMLSGEEDGMLYITKVE